MREILPLLQRPSHYLGTEVNAVHKHPHEVRLRVALAFPDLYEIGMAYVGQKILYQAINQRSDWWAERVFVPGRDAAALLKKNGLVLSTLESDTPLKEMDVLAFSLTHELCYTSVLHMLDLAGIPFRATQRAGEWPLVIGGGGISYQPEPVAPFFDLLGVGDGEKVLPRILAQVSRAKADGWSKQRCIESLKGVKGIYVPGCFRPDERTGRMHAVCEGIERVEREVAGDLDSIPYPVNPVVPFGKVIHDRYTVEIARGCTRGCRFCHAGMVYRPVRERSLKKLDELLRQGLNATGFEEVSFLSLSTGDFSALEGLFDQSLDRCRQEQISISLPSLRVGSLSPRLMGMISGIRRTGATLAPEAGSQRLRDVINKGITEEELLEHTRALFGHGWNGIKLYFMIGLPTETEEDLRAILDLCLKVLQTAEKKNRRLQVTASLSPFVPKPHTPFQWETQLGMEEVRSRLGFLKSLFASHKRLNLRWQEPEMSFVEGVFSRGGRELSSAVEIAYEMGDVLTSWAEHFSLERWLKAFDASGIDPRACLGARETDAALPWDHIDAGVDKPFLLRERHRALTGRVTQDCRYAACRNCGACDCQDRILAPGGGAGDTGTGHRLNLSYRDQSVQDTGQVSQESRPAHLDVKATHLRLWYSKTGPAAYLSQLELQRVFERAFRRIGLSMTFSKGYHPLPLLSFGRALSVGVQSREEWVNIFLREEQDVDAMRGELNAELPRGLEMVRIESLSLGRRQPQAVMEDFCITYKSGAGEALACWRKAMRSEHLWIEHKTRKGTRRKDVRSFLREWTVAEHGNIGVRMDWVQGYLSPLVIVDSVDGGWDACTREMVKVKQWMEGQKPRPLESFCLATET